LATSIAQTLWIVGNIMGSVYRKCEPRKQKGRYIYNRGRLHKVGWTPKHKKKYIELMKSLDSEINDAN